MWIQSRSSAERPLSDTNYSFIELAGRLTIGDNWTQT